MRHRLGLATRTQISVCQSPFPSAGTAVSLFRAKTVQQRPLLPREVETNCRDKIAEHGDLMLLIAYCLSQVNIGVNAGAQETSDVYEDRSMKYPFKYTYHPEYMTWSGYETWAR